MSQHETQHSQNEKAPSRFQIEKLEERVAPANVAIITRNNIQGVISVGNRNTFNTAFVNF